MSLSAWLSTTAFERKHAHGHLQAILTTSFTRPLCVREYCSVTSVCSVESSLSVDVVKNTPLFCAFSSIYFLLSPCINFASCSNDRPSYGLIET